MHANYPKKATLHGRNARLRDLPHQQIFFTLPQFATLKSGRGQHRKYLPYAFTEHGAIMAASVLNSPRAVEMSVYVVRAFVRLRELLATNRAFARKLDELESRLRTHDEAITGILRTLRELMNPPASERRGIGFTADLKEGK